MKHTTQRYITYVSLILVLLVTLGPAPWNNGGIVLLDYVLTGYDSINLLSPFIFPILSILSYYFTPELVSVAFFTGILILALHLGYLMVRIFQDSSLSKYKYILVGLGSVFFLINPFSYERMMVQPTIYLGIVFLGYMIYHLLFSTEKWHSLWAGVMGGSAFIMMPHASYMVALILGLYMVCFVRSIRDMGRMILVGGIILLLNLNWLLAPFFGVGNSTGTIATFGTGNLEAFETQALAPLEVWGTNILLYGFWGERYGNHYARVDILSSLWYVAGFLLVGLMIYGYYRFYRSGRKRETWMLGMLGLFSLIFGIGIASPLTDGLTRWMIEYIPLWQGYREPQKWIGLLMIVEGIGLILGTAYVLDRFREDSVVRGSLVSTIFLLLIIWSPGPLMGYHGQLRTTVYPSEFETVRAELLTTSGAKVLALPWHSYIGCNWMGRPTISNPIKGLLGGVHVVSSDNIEVANILYSNSSDTESQIVENFIRSSEHSIVPLQERGFTHIILMEGCANSDSYKWLDTIDSCQKESSSKAHTLYDCSR